MLEGLKGLFASKKALLIIALLGVYAGFVFSHLMTVAQFSEQTLPVVLAYLGVEGATGITAIIKGVDKRADASTPAETPAPIAAPAAEVKE